MDSQALGRPRLHLRQVDSTNLRARMLAAAGAPHGTLITAAEQVAGRGRQGRQWSSPPGTSLSMSLIIREPRPLLSLAAGVAVAETVDAILAASPDALSIDGVSTKFEGVEQFRHAPARGGGEEPAGSVRAQALIKWPNDILLADRKVAGILVEGRPLERWAVLGIGINVAIPPEAVPLDLRGRAGTLGLPPSAIESTLTRLLRALEYWLAAGGQRQLAAVRERDALLGERVSWAQGSGTAAGIDADGRLLVELDSGAVALEAGEVHLSRRES